MQYSIYVRDILEFIYNIFETGKLSWFRDLYNLSNPLKEEIIHKTINKQVVEAIRNRLTLPNTSVTICGERIEFWTEIRFIACGIDKNNVNLEKEIPRKFKMAALSNPRIELSSIVYDVEFYTKNYDPEAMIKLFKKQTDFEAFKGFSIYKIKIHEKDLSVLKSLAKSKWFSKMPKKMEFDENQTWEDFGNTLKEEGLTNAAIKSEKENMEKIDKHTKAAFPEFMNLATVDQSEILSKAYYRSLTSKSTSRDINLLAKATFEELAAHRLHTRFYMEGKEYTLVCEYRHDRVVDELVFRNEIRMLEYHYKTKTGVTLKTCFNPFTLWHLIATGENEGEHEYGQIA